MEVSLAQQHPGVDAHKQENPPVSRKRHTLKKWFHYAVYGDDFEDSFDNEESVVIEDGDDLIFIPTLPRMPNSLFSSNKKVSPLIFEQNQNRENYRRQKLKAFKLHLKLKMNLATGDANENGKYSSGDKSDFSQDNYDALECYQMFKSEPEDLDALFDYTMKSALESKSSLERSDFDYSTSPVKELQPFQNLSYEDINSFRRCISNVQPVSFSPVDIWDKSEDNCEDSSEIPTARGTINYSKEEDCPTLSMDSTEMESPMTSESAERSFERTPSVYLTNELIFKEGPTMVSSYKEGFNRARNVLCEEIHRTQNTLCSPGTSSISSSNNSNDSNTIIYTIPTFKQKRGELNISGIIRSFKNGTLTEKKLRQVAMKGSQRVTFRSKEFYDEPPISAQDVQTEQTKGDDLSSITFENDEGEDNVKDVTGVIGSDGGVKFDKYSNILVYKPAGRNSQTKKYGCPTSRVPSGQHDMFTARSGEPCSLSDKMSKSILKKSANEREAEEIVRATHCDGVDMGSFLAFFEHFEHQKHSQESKLSKFREQQLRHYYSKEFFPELQEDAKSTLGHNSEYRRSKRATELNIGRKIDEIEPRFSNVMEPCYIVSS